MAEFVKTNADVYYWCIRLWSKACCSYGDGVFLSLLWMMKTFHANNFCFIREKRDKELAEKRRKEAEERRAKEEAEQRERERIAAEEARAKRAAENKAKAQAWAQAASKELVEETETDKVKGEE